MMIGKQNRMMKEEQLIAIVRVEVSRVKNQLLADL